MRFKRYRVRSSKVKYNRVRSSYETVTYPNDLWQREIPKRKALSMYTRSNRDPQLWLHLHLDTCLLDAGLPTVSH